MEFDFITAPPKEPVKSMALPETPGPNLGSIAHLTGRSFAKSVLEVYHRLGGATWLYLQAEANPAAFMELLKKMIPKSVELSDLEGLSIRLIDQFGNQVAIDAHGAATAATATPAPAALAAPVDSLPHAETATGGSPAEGVSPAPESPSVRLTDTFEEDISNLFVDMPDHGVQHG